MIRKILLVSSAFYPENSPRSFRATELAREFARQGQEVTVITQFRDHDYTSFLLKNPVNLKMWSKPVFPKISCRNTSNRFFSLICKGLSRWLLMLFEYPGIEEMFKVKEILKMEEGYNIIISFAVPYPVHWGVAWSRSSKHTIGKTWIADCGDPYMFSRLDTFKKLWYFKYLEKYFCRKADYITVPFNEMKLQFYDEFITKIMVIPQGFNLDEINLYKGNVTNNIPTFIYAGTLIPGKRDLSLFLDFLSSLQLDFRFIVYTNQQEMLSKFKAVLNNKLEVHDYIDRLSLLYEMSKSDFLVNVDTILDDNKNVEAVPSKLIDYCLSGRPILNINSESFEESTIMSFLNRDYSRKRVLDKSNYDIVNVANKFLKLAFAKE